MSFSVRDDSNSSDIVSTSDHNSVVVFKVKDAFDVSCLQVELDGVVHFDVRVGVSDGLSVMSNDVRNLVGAEGSSLNLRQLGLGFLLLDFVEGKSSFNVKQHSEVLTSLID